ncbi:hypothetical protein KA062_00470 [Patescibacteria group bacterium]|nr:hypothetical protein [Patescibacteria group bacterium]
MSTKGGTYKGHKFHGDPQRFEVVAGFVFETFGRNIEYIADVAGGRGMLSRVLNKKYNYKSTVVDPRGYPLLGVDNLQEEFSSEDASYYDLVIGLHPDEATIEVAKSALGTNTILIPCCNFWNQNKKLGRDAMISEISKFYESNGVKYKVVTFDFEGPKNIGLVTMI